MKKLLTVFLVVMCLIGALGIMEGKIEGFLLFAVSFTAICLMFKKD